MSPDPVCAFSQHHLALSMLSGDVLSGASDRDKAAALSQLSKVFAGHAASLKSVVMPALSAAGFSEVPHKVLASLKDLQSTLELATSLSAGSVVFEAAVMTLDDHINEHVELEVALLFPPLGATFTAAEQQQLVSAIEHEVETFV